MNRFRSYLIKKLIGKTPVIANVRCDGGWLRSNGPIHLYGEAGFTGCIFKGEGKGPRS